MPGTRRVGTTARPPTTSERRTHPPPVTTTAPPRRRQPPRPAPRPRPQPQPQPQPQPRPVPRPQPHPQPQPQPRPAPRPRPRAEHPETRPQLQPQPQAQPRPAPRPRPRAEQPETRPQPQPQPQPQSRPAPRPQPRPEQRETQPESQPQPRPTTKTRPRPRPRPQSRPQSRPQTRPQPQRRPQLSVSPGEPLITCPEDQRVELKPSRNSSRVRFPRPRNSLQTRLYVNGEPVRSDDGSLQAELPSGRHRITFVTHSLLTDSPAKCSFNVDIVDLEPPRVRRCPESFDILLKEGQMDTRVNWEEPLFSDNVGVVNTWQSIRPNSRLPEGKHRAFYIALDKARNRANCSFTINVTRTSSPSVHLMLPRRQLIVCPASKYGKALQMYAWHVPPGCTAKEALSPAYTVQSEHTRRSSHRRRASRAHRVRPRSRGPRPQRFAAAPTSLPLYKESYYRDKVLSTLRRVNKLRSDRSEPADPAGDADL
ncbi:BUD13 homolog [Pollicipes pollicipes]|uniref:BUD13 homolog n=1 Tax=Pollicipes pollicipes TaxID=41117 RepID=UPI00188556CF|nr:BUD13 homolog [Pollicipes pollicipes]